MSTSFFKENLRLPAVQENNWILHADLDSFYASVEVKLHPELKGKPVIVGPDPKLGHTRGVVLTCSYEARKFGVRSAMPIMKAHALCPNAVYSSSGFENYRRESSEVMNVFSKFVKDDNISRVSIDEAFMNISDKELIKNEKEVKNFCKEIKNTVWEEVELPVSIGASHTRQIAKIGSQLAKPNGVLVIPKDKFRQILDPLSLDIISGVGKKSYKRLQELGYQKIGDISKFEYGDLPHKSLHWIWLTANGIILKSSQRMSNRSHSRERTFREDISDRLLIRKALRKLLMSLLKDLSGQSFKTVTIKLRNTNFKTTTRSHSFDFYINPSENERICLQKANELLNLSFNTDSNMKYRLLGIKASNFRKGGNQRSVAEFFNL